MRISRREGCGDNESFDLILMDVKGKGNPTAGLDATELILADKPDASSCWSPATKACWLTDRAQSIAMSTGRNHPQTSNLRRSCGRHQSPGAPCPRRLAGPPSRESTGRAGFGQGISQMGVLRLGHYGKSSKKSSERWLMTQGLIGLRSSVWIPEPAGWKWWLA